MDCEKAQEAILESLLVPQSDVQGAIDAHVAACPSCAAFVRAQRDLDRQLSAHMRPPSLGPGFRAEVRRRVRKESHALWPDLLPDTVHFASWAVVTLLGLTWIPFSAPVVLAAAATGSLLTHVVLTALHESLDAAEDLAS